MYDQKIRNIRKLGQSVHAYLFKVEQEEPTKVEEISNKRFFFMAGLGISVIVIMGVFFK